MDFLSRLVGGKSEKVDGLIGFYNLGDWWLTEFTKPERRYICDHYKPMGFSADSLAQGSVTTSQPVTLFLSGLSTWFTSKEDAHIAERILAKMKELGVQQPSEAPGSYQGRHYSTYVERMDALREAGELDELERLCVELVKATEEEAKLEKLGVAPAYYLELAWIYRERKDYASEVAILERLSRQRYASNYKPEHILRMMEKAKKNLAK